MSPLDYVSRDMRRLFAALPYRRRICAYDMGLSALHLCGAITFEQRNTIRLRRTVMSSVAIMVEARGEDGEAQLRVTAEQFFKEKPKQLKFQEALLMKAVGAFSEVSLDQRKEEQGV